MIKQERKMKKITYGVAGLVDWVALIGAGAATVRVHFSGGALTQYGITPAEYTTASPFIQRVIEQSEYFRNGKISVLRVRETEEKPKAAVRLAAGRRREAEASSPNQVGLPDLGIGTGKAAPMAGAGEPDQRTGTGEVSAGGAGKGAGTRVEVACLQDAQAYLQENFGIATHRVRSCEAAQRAAMEHGIVFTGDRFDECGGE